jgi:hypothetical protein
MLRPYPEHLSTGAVLDVVLDVDDLQIHAEARVTAVHSMLGWGMQFTKFLDGSSVHLPEIIHRCAAAAPRT